jgi:HEPN superfamily Toprim-like protein
MLDASKNSMGVDHGALFQEGDLTRRRAEEGSHGLFVERQDEGQAAFARPLSRVLLRLDLLGHTLEGARAEYEDLVRQMAEFDEDEDPPPSHLSFEEFSAFCCRYPVSTLSHATIDFDEPDRDRLAQGRFSQLGDEIDRIPRYIDGSDIYWSEASFFGRRMFVLSPYSMLQVLGQSESNADAEVMWLFGPLCDSGWEDPTSFVAGARRDQTLLVATEGTTDARIIRRALEVLQPDVADFFRFIDVDERHPFWGTGNLVKFAEGLVRIDVQNKVIFLLDNDAEGVDAVHRLQSLGMPRNMRALLLPRQEAFARFPARGPGGVETCDINGRAAAIECYLDLDLPGLPSPQVVWSNYKRDGDTWQGALEHKESYMRHFLNQSDEALQEGSYDTSKLEAVLATLLQEATSLASGSAPFMSSNLP